ncbi:MAG: hypothetical protein HQL56_10255 [Magnetococcales bacterium]|nr:hypothetical protein [Magnetococcales bacterium]
MDDFKSVAEKAYYDVPIIMLSVMLSFVFSKYDRYTELIPITLSVLVQLIVYSLSWNFHLNQKKIGKLIAIINYIAISLLFAAIMVNIKSPSAALFLYKAYFVAMLFFSVVYSLYNAELSEISGIYRTLSILVPLIMVLVVMLADVEIISMSILNILLTICLGHFFENIVLSVKA